MFRSPWSAMALVQALSGVVLAGFFAVQSVQTGAPVLLIGVVIGLVGFGIPAYRNVRRDREHRAGQASGPLGGWSGPVARRPTLSEEGDAALVHVIGVLGAAGVLAPRTPDPDHLTEAVADLGEPVTAGSVLDAFDDAAHHHPEFRPDDHRAALAGHAVDVEQTDDVLRAQADDLARLLDGVLDVRLDDATVTDELTVLRLRLDGTRHVLDYVGHGKALSTVLHVTIARALRQKTDRRRLAWVWTDRHAWITALRADVTVGGLNGDLDAPASERWEWVDEQEPVAAGEV